MLEAKVPKIRVLVRKRPISKKELARGEKDIVSIESGQTVIVRQPKVKVDLTPYIQDYKLNFDGAYDEHATNQYIYSTAVQPLVDCAFDGAKVSCFAYGQTGSGKTHTMLGNGSTVRGLYLLAAEDIFLNAQNRPDFRVYLSFYEIYCGKLYDLLNDKNILFARQDSKNNVNIVGLSETQITSSQDLMEYISFGTAARVTSQNGTNTDSSRSHAILQIALKKKNKVHGKISFIDLAGSERAADHADQLQKQTRIDGAQINKSLLALKECIRALDQNKHHTPFRGSKLTMVLKDSFTGYCRTVMIGNVSPNSGSSENTLNTLKYADRVKELKKARENPLQLDRVEQLEKELMLPRNGYNLQPKPMHKGVVLETSPKGRENQKAGVNKQSARSKPKVIQAKTQPKSVRKVSQRGRDDLKGLVAEVNQATDAVGNVSNLYSPPRNSAPQPAYTAPVVNNFMGRNNNASPPKQQLDIGLLSQKHDQYIQLILEQEQNLIKQHEQHINETIETTKAEMQLRNEADKIGSNIEDYLDSLQGLLERKMGSIRQLQGKITAIKGYLGESKRIEEQYSLLEKHVFQQQEEGMLDDDEELFV